VKSSAHTPAALKLRQFLSDGQSVVMVDESHETGGMLCLCPVSALTLLIFSLK